MYHKEGKVALVLAGGGARGAYEAGAWQALKELGIEIDIVTGTSVGSINGAMVCLGDLDLTIKLWKELETHMIFDVDEGSQSFDYAKEIVLNRGAGTSRLRELLEKYIDEDKIRKSPVDYGLVATELKSLKSKQVFKEDIPEGQLFDYILASASAFPAIHAHEIDGVEYIDGGYTDVIPVGLALKKNPTKIIAVRLRAPGIVRTHFKERDLPKDGITYIESKWDLGTVLIFDTDNARRIMRLGYLDTMKTFEIFDGSYYTFAKGAFNKTDTKLADYCAKIFDMDPTLIYTKDSFSAKLEDIIKDSELELEDALTKLKHFNSKFVTASELLKDLKNAANTKLLTFVIAAHLKEKGEDSIFLNRAVMKVAKEPIMAARFILKYGLI